MDTIKRINEVNTENIKFSKLRDENRHKFVSVFYNNHKFRIHSPKVRIPFGIKKFGNNYVLQVSISDSNMKEMLYNVDEFLKQAGTDNSKEWFQTNKDVGKFKSNIKQSGTFPPLLSIKLPRDSLGEYKFSVYDDKKEKIEITNENIEEVFEKGTIIKPILECVGVWFKDNTYGISWKLFQAKVESKMKTCFVEDSDVDSEIEFIE